MSEARPGPGKGPSGSRLAREIEFHRSIADRAELVWNWDTPAGRSRAERRAALFVEHALLGAGRRALEVGCGTGLFLDQVARSGATLHALDLSTHLLARTRARVAGHAHVSLQCGNAEQMPYPDACFDAVYGSSVLHHLDLDRALREVFRVLRPGGRAVFTEPNIVNPQVAVMFHLGATKSYFGVSPDEMAFSRFRAVRALRAAGFREGHATPFDFLHPSTPASWVAAVSRLGLRAERTPVLREIAGSLLVRAVKP
ncbi:MAG TPA: class I SAM-dependent methyltransferase [Vicinamibacteria bacterium]|nr:class I SAM-dependent methyltransferase [Vicinamibacteria bacterium]